ncbi:MAG: hypothetical protein U0835_05990 [Isosphaeraceae bacterium]
MRVLKAASLSLTAAILFAASGCSDQAGVEEKTKITGPEGTTTITKETKVESSGDNPPVPVTTPSTTTPSTTGTGTTGTATEKTPNP